MRVKNQELLVLGDTELKNFDRVLNNSRDVDAELVQYRMHDKGYLLAIIDGTLVGVLKFDQMLGPKEIFIGRKDEVETLINKVCFFSNSLEINSKDDLVEAGQFARNIIGQLKSVLNDAFDAPTIMLSRARALLMEALKYQQTQKLVWSSPVQTAEREIREKMEKWVLKKELEDRKEVEEEQREVISDDVILCRIEEAKKRNDQGEVDNLLSMWDRLEEDGPADMVPIGEKQKIDMGPGVSMRTLFRYKVVDIATVKLEYIVEDKGAIQKLVNKHGYEAEAMVGGIEVFEKKSTAIRGLEK